MTSSHKSTYRARARLWRWSGGKANWSFLTLPARASREIRLVDAGPRRAGFGALSLDRLLGYLDFRASLIDGPLEAFTCFAGTTAQEVFATSEPMRAACGATITDHAATLTGCFAAAIAQHRPRLPVSAESLALYTQTVLQGGFVLSKSAGNRAPLLDAITHLKNYLKLLFKERKQ